MAFFRFTRDKRGYQHFYLVEPIANRRGQVRQRVLYWFRSPPDIKVGREPFDEGIRRALETQNPDVTFDWRSILDAPIPSAETDKWRERRRAERAAKQAMSSAAVDDESAELEDADASAREDEGAPSRAPLEPAAAAAAAGESLRKKRRRRRKRPAAAAGPMENAEPRETSAVEPSGERGDPPDE
jgi:hypothetical protein